MATLNDPTDPPKYADRFFEWYCNPDLQEEILGDLYERFQQRIAKRGLWNARLWYWISVVLFINKYTLRRKKRNYSPLYPLDMYRSYFKVGLRNMFKHKFTSLVNILGMALAIGGCLVIFNFLDSLYNLDDFHKKRDEIFVLEYWLNQDDDRKLWSNVPEPLGVQIAIDFPQVKAAVRLNYDGVIVQKEDKVFREFIAFTDPAFFDLFDFPIKYGSVEHFSDPNSVVLTQELAIKYFGSENPVGKTLQFRFSSDTLNKREDLVVKAVFGKLPINASFQFNMLLPYAKQQALRMTDFQDWSKQASITFLHIPDTEAIPQIKTKESQYLALLNQANEGWEVDALHFQALHSISHRKIQSENSPFNQAHIIAILLLAFIAAALLILVCFNYMNIAMASIASRLKEISVRKVMGGHRWNIISQFLSENLLICFFALLLGISLAELLFQPWFNGIVGEKMSLDYWGNWRLWLIAASLVLLTAIGGAGYPAFYISSFRPVAILKDTFRFRSKNRFRKILLSGQFLLTFVAICAAIAFLLEGKALQKKSWGYNQASLLVLQLEYGENYKKLKEVLETNPSILSVSGSAQQMGSDISASTYQIEGKVHRFNSMEVEFNYLETLNIPIIQGRDFDEKQPTDQEKSIVVNKALSTYMNWGNPIGKVMKIESEIFRVIGETENFHYYPFYEEVKPLVLQVVNHADIHYLTARTTPGNLAETAQLVQGNWKNIYPNTPYDFYFLDSAFDSYFRGLGQLTNILTATALLTVFISIIGLFGLALLIITQKMREMSIRKILGANIFQLSYRLNQEFLLAILIASILGCVLAYLLISNLFNFMSYDSTVGISPFVWTILFLVLMSSVSISLHIYRLAISNPSSFLREE